MRPLLALALLIAAPAALAQKDPHAHHRRAESVIDRADTTRVPASLTPEEMAGLLEGRGMGLARAAERNHYPGPLHVLELADSLGLTAAQRAEAERLRAEMLAEARLLGRQIVAQEQALDALFARGRATPAAVSQQTASLAALQGRLRAAHLNAHVALRGVLTPHQVAEYSRLRGYATGR